MTLPTIDRRSALKLGLSGLALLGLPSLPSPAFAATTKGISYGPNQLDIYAPDNAANAPVILYIHGGAWRAGSRGSVGSKPAYFNAKGYVFVSAGYTLFPRADAEAQAMQVARAFRWVSANIGKYGGNPSRIAMMGHSAGCHLTALAVLSGAATPRSVVFNDTGAYDLAYLAEINGGRLPSLYSALGRKEKWTRWSPINYVSNRSQPPSLVMWSGGRDRDRISKRFADALSRYGSVTRFDGRRYSHISIDSAIGRAGDSATNAVDRFLASTL